ncbi:unnamed protein product [Closterium sp. NIES-54]
MYAFADSAEGDCYLSVPPDSGIAAAALGASASAAPGTNASAAPGAGASALSGTAPSEAFHTFTLDSGASRSFFRDSTTLTPLSRPVAVSLADPSRGPVLAHSSTVLPCSTAPLGLLSGLHLPSFSKNLVSGAYLQDAWVDQFTPGGQRVTHCTCSRMGRHLAPFTRRPGSSLYTLTTAPPSISTSGQVAASIQVFAATSRSSPASAPCSCRPLSHETLLWHHRLGHPSLPRLRGPSLVPSGFCSHVLRYGASAPSLPTGSATTVSSQSTLSPAVDDLATQRSSQGYTFSLSSGSVSWRSTRSSSILSSSCEAEIYAGAMAAQELRWLTYLLTDLGEAPRSPPILYVDNKAMLALCQEHRLEHRTKHIALRYFLAQELQQRGQLRLAYVASQANSADVFTKALQPFDHQRFYTVLRGDFVIHPELALPFLTGLVTSCFLLVPTCFLVQPFIRSQSNSGFKDEEVLSQVISGEQYGFLLGKRLTDAVSLVADFIDAAKNKNSDWYLLLIDFEKVYDSVRRNFMLETIAKLVFPSRFVGCIEALHRDVHTRLCVNGWVGEKIKMRKGVRQGCPLAPYLFLCAVEPLSCLVEEQNLGIGEDGCERLAYIGYAYDTTVLLEGKHQLKMAKQVLKEFAEVSGPNVNKGKSC